MGGDWSGPDGLDFHEGHQDAVSCSFIVYVSDDRIFEANLLASPCLQPGSLHEVIAIRDCPDAAAGLSLGIARARNERVVCVHQDVFLPGAWDRLMANQYRLAEREFGPIGVAGVYGVGGVMESPGAVAGDGDGWRVAGKPGDVACHKRLGGLAARRVGWVVDRGRILSEGPWLPARIAVLDEMLLVMRRGMPMRFDPALGFHLYGADLCLQARERGLAVVVLGAPCRHNSRNVGLPEAFLASADVLARKWEHCLPIATPCVVFDRAGGVFVLGNTTAERFIAHAEGSPLTQVKQEFQMNTQEIANSSPPYEGGVGGGGFRSVGLDSAMVQNPPVSPLRKGGTFLTLARGSPYC